MKKIINNASGSVMVQVMVAAALVIGGAAYVINSNHNQNKLRSGVANKMTQSVIQKEISEILSNADICKSTMMKKAELSNDMVLDGLYNKDDKLIYGANQELYNNTITEFKLTDYTPSAGAKYQMSNLQVSVKSKEADGKSYGAKTRNYKIPLFLLTEDNKVDTCMHDGAGSILSALKKACEELKGTFNEATARCENFHGTNGSFIKYIRDHLCSSQGIACVHPYNNQTCSGVDIRGEDHGNWVFTGFDANGQKECQCVPVKCPNPALYCLGRNLGTDWCQQVCPVGAKTDGACAPPATPPTTPPPAPPTTPPPASGTTTGSSAGGSTTRGSGGGGCFIAGTQVALANGETKNIEDIVVGDKVLTFDELTSSQIVRPVVQALTHKKKKQEIYEFLLSNGVRIVSNDIHPFYLINDGEYRSAAEIFLRWERKEDIHFLTLDHTTVSVTSIKKSYRNVEVFNLHVGGAYDADRESAYNHNYFANGVLVHNKRVME